MIEHVFGYDGRVRTNVVHRLRIHPQIRSNRGRRGESVGVGF